MYQLTLLCLETIYACGEHGTESHHIMDLNAGYKRLSLDLFGMNFVHQPFRTRHAAEASGYGVRFSLIWLGFQTYRLSTTRSSQALRPTLGRPGRLLQARTRDRGAPAGLKTASLVSEPPAIHCVEVNFMFVWVDGQVLVLVYSQSTTRQSQAFRPFVRPGRRWRGSNPRQKGPCRSQGGLPRWLHGGETANSI
ncbi:hypothetical protein PoB_005420000 [Plakobranchus ocellatus]|uniref:Uncharacterized protein n=1 Tax=Plakobranchus ocellatus TaxID=259542 RepID=A0AAV4C7N9_9GAST|nr:hypothetical protein PoB_005420000 [Plakobranchus ocellatus]